MDSGAREPIPLSLLNDFLYCPRRAAIKGIEGVRRANAHTLEGDLLHEHADLPGYEIQAGATLLRALPVFSERLGLSGKCDIVETTPGPPPEYRPVEYKKGKRREFDNDDAQLCAQALCLEEMTGTVVRSGAVYHAQSKRRREVAFSPELRRSTETALADLRTLLAAGKTPGAVFRPQCEECSLFDYCLPALTAHPERVQQESDGLFQP